MKLKKLSALLLAGAMCLSIAACSSSSDTKETTPATDTVEESGAVASDLSVGVFYYTYSDVYITSVRTALDAALDGMGITYQLKKRWNLSAWYSFRRQDADADSLLINSLKTDGYHRLKKDLEKKNTINSLIWLVATILYFLLSFGTGAWYITWLIWLIAPCVQMIVNLMMDGQKS